MTTKFVPASELTAGMHVAKTPYDGRSYREREILSVMHHREEGDTTYALANGVCSTVDETLSIEIEGPRTPKQVHAIRIAVARIVGCEYWEIGVAVTGGRIEINLPSSVTVD
jgi:hypothetical protein